MDDKRTQFTFYESFYKALQRIKDPMERAMAYDILCEYALYGTEHDLEDLPETVAMFFELCKPNLDTARRKSAGGRNKDTAKSGEDTSKSKPEQRKSKATSEEVSEPKPEDTDKTSVRCDEDTDKIPTRPCEDTANKKKKKKEKEKEVENKKEKENKNKCYYSPPYVPPHGGDTPEAGAFDDFSPELRAATERWITYKAERKETYQPTGFKSLISQIRKGAAEHGDQAMIEVIDTSMASQYQGIVFDRLRKYPAAPPKPKPIDLDELRRIADMMGGVPEP